MFLTEMSLVAIGCIGVFGLAMPEPGRRMAINR
jgi:hypothetical protein